MKALVTFPSQARMQPVLHHLPLAHGNIPGLRSLA
jgi:hypothetical protein